MPNSKEKLRKSGFLDEDFKRLDSVKKELEEKIGKLKKGTKKEKDRAKNLESNKNGILYMDVGLILLEKYKLSKEDSAKREKITNEIAVNHAKELVDTRSDPQRLKAKLAEIIMGNQEYLTTLVELFSHEKQLLIEERAATELAYEYMLGINIKKMTPEQQKEIASKKEGLNAKIAALEGLNNKKVSDLEADYLVKNAAFQERFASVRAQEIGNKINERISGVINALDSVGISCTIEKNKNVSIPDERQKAIVVSTLDYFGLDISQNNNVIKVTSNDRVLGFDDDEFEEMIKQIPAALQSKDNQAIQNFWTRAEVTRDERKKLAHREAVKERMPAPPARSLSPPPPPRPVVFSTEPATRKRSPAIMPPLVPPPPPPDDSSPSDAPKPKSKK